jgi:hypothetical protein
MYQNPFLGDILVTFSERLSYKEDELMSEIGWHEGGRMRDLKNNLNIEAKTAVGTIIAKKDNKWYASDDKGIFSFEVPLDKVSYPTTRFFTPDIAMIIDTHGVNMLVEQAIRKEANVVLSDCDHEGKTKAAIYLSKHNISVICFPDRFTHMALGHDANLVGSPVWRFENNSMIYGDSPLLLEKYDDIVVTNADLGKSYAVWYYTTPFFYFSFVNMTFPLNITVSTIDDFGQLDKVFDIARQKNINIVATRIFNKDDYTKAKEWMDENKERRIILFHSTMYPYGIKFMQEYINRVSFNDPNIKPVAKD